MTQASLEQILATREKTLWPYSVLVEAAVNDSAAAWCNDCCTGRWRSYVLSVSPKENKQVKFQFSNEQDLVLFCLKWSR